MYALKADFLQGISLAFHSRLISIVIWLLALLVATVLLAAEFSARQPMTVALDVGFSIIRLTLPLLAVLLMQELISREFERKLFLNSFTYPRPRSSWLLGRVLSVFALCTATLVIMGCILALLVTYGTGDYKQGTPVSLGLPYMTTLLFIAVDLIVVISMAALLAVSASTPSFVLVGTIGFTLIARSYTPIIELLQDSPYTVAKFADPRIYQDSLSSLAFILPDLGRLDVRMISLYDKYQFLPTDWPELLFATLAYSTALLAIASFVLNKREYN